MYDRAYFRYRCDGGTKADQDSNQCGNKFLYCTTFSPTRVMKNILIVSLVFLSLNLKAQDTSISKHDSIPAKISGGENAWRRFLERNVHPQVAADNFAPPGIYTVTVSFVVDTTGKVSDVYILKDPGYGTANDVLRAFKHCPDWVPATIDGKPVKYRQKQNIYYQVSQQ
jgi:hypothetical protein